MERNSDDFAAFRAKEVVGVILINEIHWRDRDAFVAETVFEVRSVFHVERRIEYPLIVAESIL